MLIRDDPPHVWSISDSTKFSGQHQTARNCISHDLEARAASTFTFTKNSTFSGLNSKTIPISSELFHYNFDQLINFNMFQLILRYMMNNSILQFQYVSWSMSPAPNVNTLPQLQTIMWWKQCTWTQQIYNVRTTIIRAWLYELRSLTTLIIINLDKPQ